MNLAFFVLSVIFEGRKSYTKGGRASAKETLECFIDFQKVWKLFSILSKYISDGQIWLCCEIEWDVCQLFNTNSPTVRVVFLNAASFFSWSMTQKFNFVSVNLEKIIGFHWNSKILTSCATTTSLKLIGLCLCLLFRQPILSLVQGRWGFMAYRF